MKADFNSYPALVFKLTLALLLLNIAYGIYYFKIFYTTYGYSEYSLDGIFSGRDFFFIESFMVVIAGWAVDRASRVKQALLWTASILFLGVILGKMPSRETLILSMILVNGGIWGFAIVCYLHTAVLYPRANDFKDNAFMILLLAAQFAFFLLNMLYGFVFNNYDESIPFLIQMGALVLLFTLFVNSKNIGYKIEESEEDIDDLQQKVAPWKILVGLTLMHTIFLLGRNYILLLGNPELNYNNYNAAFVNSIQFVLLLLFLAFIFWLFRSVRSSSRQVSKIRFGLALMIGVGVLEMIVRGSQSFELNIISNRAMDWVYLLLVAPALLSVITHLNFSEKAGFWLGIFLGIPRLVVELSSRLSANNPMVMVLVVLILIIASWIWLNENQEQLRGILRLDEANQEEEEVGDLEQDPFDHLIG